MKTLSALQLCEQEIELKEDVVVIESLCDSIDEAVTYATTISEMMQVISTESLDATAITLLNTSVSDLYDRLGVEASDNISLESISDKLSTVWTAIKKAIRALWDKVVDFVNKILDLSIGTKKRLEHLKDSVAGITYKGQVDEVIDDEHLLDAFNIGDGATVAGIIGVNERSAALIKRSNDFMKHIVELVNKIATIDLENELVYEDTKLTKILGTAINSFGSDLVVDQQINTSIVGDKEAIVYYGPLLHDTVLVFEVKSGLSVTFSKINDLMKGKVTMEELSTDMTFKELNRKSNNKDLPLANASDLVKVVDSAIGLNDSFETTKKNLNIMDKAIKSSAKIADNAIKEARDNVPEELRRNLTITKDIMMGVRKMLSVTNTQLPRMAMSTVQTTITYSNKSLINLKKLETG